MWAFEIDLLLGGELKQIIDQCQHQKTFFENK